MAIQPIDLQALLAQLDNVAKTQLAQRDGHALQQSLQGAQLQRKASEKEKAVGEVQNTGEDGPEKVNDEGRKGHDGGRGEKRNPGQVAAGFRENEPPPVFRDPTLGKNVDINF
jgi:hypothetical protein